MTRKTAKSAIFKSKICVEVCQLSEGIDQILFYDCLPFTDKFVIEIKDVVSFSFFFF